MFLPNSNVQKTPGGHFGIIRVPTLSHMIMGFIALLTKLLGGINQLFSKRQLMQLPRIPDNEIELQMYRCIFSTSYYEQWQIYR